jgi:DNA modification methylase
MAEKSLGDAGAGMMATSTILTGDCLEVLRGLPDGMAQTCVTSPPYYGLRDYGHAGQIGLEETPDAYVARLVDVFREVRRVLRDDGTLWLNLGDSYARAGGEGGCGANAQVGNTKSGEQRRNLVPPSGYKPKDLLGIPWMVAFALRADGWWLRQDIIWHKPNPMPESVTDRCTKAHEYVFLLTKSARYFYDADSIREAPTGRTDALSVINTGADNGREKRTLKNDGTIGANARSVWPIATQPYSGAHFATMPPALAERCIKAGSKPGDMVLDPFGGAGTTGLVADRLGRSATLIELNPEYARLARERITADAPLLVAQ